MRRTIDSIVSVLLHHCCRTVPLSALVGNFVVNIAGLEFGSRRESMFGLDFVMSTLAVDLGPDLDLDRMVADWEQDLIRNSDMFAQVMCCWLALLDHCRHNRRCPSKALKCHWPS